MWGFTAKGTTEAGIYASAGLLSGQEASKRTMCFVFTVVTHDTKDCSLLSVFPTFSGSAWMRKKNHFQRFSFILPFMALPVLLSIPSKQMSCFDWCSWDHQMGNASEWANPKLSSFTSLQEVFLSYKKIDKTSDFCEEMLPLHHTNMTILCLQRSNAHNVQ